MKRPLSLILTAIFVLSMFPPIAVTANHPSGGGSDYIIDVDGGNPVFQAPVGSNSPADPAGGDPTGGNPTGGDPAGGNPTGGSGDPTGGDPTGDPAGGNPTGGSGDPAGGDPAGGNPTGGDPAGPADPAGGSGDPADPADPATGDPDADTEEDDTDDEPENEPEEPVAMLSEFSGEYPYILGDPDLEMDGNTKGWLFDEDTGRHIDALKNAPYLVLEVSKKPQGWMTIKLESDTMYELVYDDYNDEEYKQYKTFEAYIELGEWDGLAVNLWDVYDYVNGALVIELDREYDWYIWHYDEDTDEHHVIHSEQCSLSEILTEDTMAASLYVAYHLWDNDDPWGNVYGRPVTGWQDLGVTAAYLADRWDDFGAPEPTMRIYEVSDTNPDWRDVVGFKIEAIRHEPQCHGRVQMMREVDWDDENTWDEWVHWGEGWFIDRGGSQYLEFDFDGWTVLSDWHNDGITDCTIIISCDCLGAEFGDMEYMYTPPAFPADINSGHSAFNSAVLLKDLGLYEGFHGARNYVLPNAYMTRWELAMQINRMTGFWAGTEEHWKSQIGAFAAAADDGGYIYGDEQSWDNEWALSRIMNVVENGYMELKTGWDWIDRNGENGWYYDHFRAGDRVTLMDLYRAAAVIAGLVPPGANTQDICDQLRYAGIIYYWDSVYDFAKCDEIYTVLAKTVQYLGREEKYNLPERDNPGQADMRWTTTGFEHEGPVDMPVAVFRQYNSVVLELDSEPPMRQNIRVELEQGWHMWQCDEWYSIEDVYQYDEETDTHMLILHYDRLLDLGSYETAAIAHVRYEGCCNVPERWVWEGEYWDDEQEHQKYVEKHEPGCPGAWQALGIQNVYLANMEQPNPPPPLTWFLDPNDWDMEFGDEHNQKGWRLGSLDRMRSLQTITLIFGNNTSIQAGQWIGFINNTELWEWDDDEQKHVDWSEYWYQIKQSDVDNGRITVNLLDYWEYRYWDIRDDIGRSGYKFGIAYYGSNGDKVYTDLDIETIFWSPSLPKGHAPDVTFYPDRYYIGPADALRNNPIFADSENDGALADTGIRGWTLSTAELGLLKQAHTLVLETSHFENSAIRFIHNNSANGWSREETVLINGVNCTVINHGDYYDVRINLSAMSGHINAISANDVDILIGYDWQTLGIHAAYLEGGFIDNFFAKYGEPFYHAGFENESHRFESWDARFDLVQLPDTPEGDGWAARISERSESWHGLNINNVWGGIRLQIGETYYLEAVVRHNEPPQRRFAFDINCENPWISLRTATVECPPEEWVTLRAFFTLEEEYDTNLNGYLHSMSFFFDGYHDDDLGHWVESTQDFYVDSVTIWGPEPPGPQPAPAINYPISTSLKDIYTDIFDVSVVVSEADSAPILGYDDEGNEIVVEERTGFIDKNTAQHYVNVYDEQNPPGSNSSITLDDTANIQGFADSLLPSGNVILLTIDETANTAQIEFLMSVLLEKRLAIDELILSSPYELFDYDDGEGGRFRLIPKAAYNVMARAPLAFFSDVYTGSNVIINQIYGTGPLDGTGSVSHSFIELYNPTDAAVNLNGWSLQIQNGSGRGGAEPPTEWQKLDLNGSSIQPYGSLLIRLQPPTSPLDNVSFVIPAADINWTVPGGFILSNRAYSAALVANQITLPMNVTDKNSAGVVDWVGAVNTAGTDVALNGNGTAARISKQVAARRIAFGEFDGANDLYNYESVDYRNLSAAEFERVRPRSGADGQWGRYYGLDTSLTGTAQLSFSAAAGVYDFEFDLTISKSGDDGNGIIWYTTDGSEPVPYSPGAMRFIPGTPIEIRDRSDDPDYFAAINLSGDTFAAWGYQHHTPPAEPVFKSNVIRAQVYDIYGRPLSKTVTNSYIINLPDEFAHLPVISVSANEFDLFDPGDGIFMPVNSDQRGAEGERPSYFEFFETKNNWEREVAQNLGLRIHGGWSRGDPQKSMRFYASSSRDADNPTVAYDIFDGNAKDVNGNPISSYRRFLLRNFGNDNYSWALMRDNMMQEAARGSNIATQDYRYAVVMLNGEFWGLYEIRERIDEHFINSKYNLGNTNVAVFENPHPDRGAEDEEALEYPADHELYKQMGQWFRSNPDLSDPALYRKAQTFIDIDNFIDMYIFEIYGSNFDWPENNTRTWRYQTAAYPSEDSELRSDNYKDGRWRFVLNDMDGTFNLYGRAGEPDPNLTQNFITNYFERLYTETAKDIDSFTMFFRSFMTNSEFAGKFINRFFDIMNTHMHPAYVISIVNELQDIIDPVSGTYLKRWTNYATRESWLGRVDVIRDFSNRRSPIVIDQMLMQNKTYSGDFNLAGAEPVTLTLRTDTAKGYINLNGIDIDQSAGFVSDASDWSGTYLTGFTQTITTLPNPGYALSHFLVNGEPVQPAEGSVLNLTLSGETTVEAVYDEVMIEAIAEFKYSDRSLLGQVAPATGGVWRNEASLEFYYADGARATLGRSQSDRNPINVPNTASPNAGWLPTAGAIDANNSAGWIITFSTVKCNNIITFSADQQTSGSGPRDFKLAYRLGTSGAFIEIPYSEASITAAGDTMQNTYYLFPLPDEIKNQETVQLKVYIAGNVSRSGGTLDRNGGNNSINNIEITNMSPSWIPREIGFDITGAGTVTADRRIAVEGDAVTLTIKAGGWKLSTLFYSYDDGGETIDVPVAAPGSTAVFTMPDESVTVKATFEMINPAMLDSDIIINQVGAKSGDSDPGGVSRSFVELYNRSDRDINLIGKSLQIANTSGDNSATGDWIVLPLRGTIPAGGYFLIIIGDSVDSGAAYQIPDDGWDRMWSTGTLSNRGFSAALVNGSVKLPEVMGEDDWANVLDFVGTHNASENIKNYLGTGTVRISAKQAVRRAGHANTGSNTADFEAVRYADYTPGDPEFDGKLPQASGLPMTVILYGDANGDGRVNGTDVQTLVVGINSGLTTGRIDEEAARVTSTTGRPDASDVLALIIWINNGGRPLQGYPAPGG